MYRFTKVCAKLKKVLLNVTYRSTFQFVLVISSTMLYFLDYEYLLIQVVNIYLVYINVEIYDNFYISYLKACFAI